MLSLKETKIKREAKISERNSKIGEIPNFNLTPGVSCSRLACMTCHKKDCYAMKAYRQYKETRKAWDSNTEMALFDPEELESQLEAYFSRMNSPRFFRIHAAGDFITREYAEMWHRIAKNHPETYFLAFTKQFDIIRGIDFNSLDNFTMILSAWPGVEPPKDLMQIYRVAHCVEKGDAIPAGAIECPGHCDNCGMCWRLRKIGMDVAFHKH